MITVGISYFMLTNVPTFQEMYEGPAQTPGADQALWMPVMDSGRQQHAERGRNRVLAVQQAAAQIRKPYRS